MTAIAMYDATVSGDGRLTLPEALRRELGVEKGGKIRFILHDDRTVTVQGARRTIDGVRGSVVPVPGTSEDFDDEIEQAWMDEVERKQRGSAARSRPALS